jgi:hypothetical protein
VVLAAKLDHLRRRGLQHPLAVDAEWLHPVSTGYWAGLPGHAVGPAHHVQGFLEVTPNPPGLIEQNKKRPRRGVGAAPGPLYPSALDDPKLRGRYSIPNAPGIITLLRLWNQSLRGRRIAYRTGIRKRERFDFCGCQYGIREQSVGMRDTFEVRAAVAPTIAH